MLVGAFYFPTDYGIDISELARALEERGFESLFCPSTPISRRAGARPGPAATCCRSAIRTRTTRSSRCPSPQRRRAP